MKTEFELLIFDLDGTLAETRQDIANATNYTRLRYTLPPLSIETISSYVGNGIQNLLERSLPQLNKSELQNALTIFSEYYAVHLLDHTYLYPGVEKFLKNSSQLKMAVLSNKAQKFTDAIINKTGIRQYFPIVIGGSKQFPKKPAADAIIFIMQKMGCSSEKTLIIGDTKNDIIAGQAAKISTCAVSYGFRSKEKLQKYKPDFMIDSIMELEKIISF